jgi:hypothetical protein
MLLGTPTSSMPQFSLPSLDEQAELAEKHQLDSLLFCPDPLALRHVFVNQDTGEVARARCNRWDCLYYGSRKVDPWRQLVKEAAPMLFLTLTKAGYTVEEAARALTTFLQYLIRGSKGSMEQRESQSPCEGSQVNGGLPEDSTPSTGVITWVSLAHFRSIRRRLRQGL